MKRKSEMWERYEKSEVIRNKKHKNAKRVSTKTEETLIKLKIYPYSGPVISPEIKLIGHRTNSFTTKTLRVYNTYDSPHRCLVVCFNWPTEVFGGAGGCSLQAKRGVGADMSEPCCWSSMQMQRLPFTTKFECTFLLPHLLPLNDFLGVLFTGKKQHDDSLNP